MLKLCPNYYNSAHLVIHSHIFYLLYWYFKDNLLNHTAIRRYINPPFSSTQSSTTLFIYEMILGIKFLLLALLHL